MQNRFSLNDILAIEEDGDATNEDIHAVIQRAINLGMWGPQGSYGRAMMDAIKSGHCLLGRAPAVDYYGNRIPSRSEVKPGSMGSIQYVQCACGDAWAATLSAI